MMGTSGTSWKGVSGIILTPHSRGSYQGFAGTCDEALATSSYRMNACMFLKIIWFMESSSFYSDCSCKIHTLPLCSATGPGSGRRWR